MFPIFSYRKLSLFFLFFFLFPPCFPARILPDSPTVLTADNQDSTWRNIANYVDADRGSHVSGMSELKRYLNRFGYLPKSESNFTDIFDDGFESALLEYQRKLGLPVTGKLDSDTLSQISLPRCGVNDVVESHRLHSTRHYAYFSGKPRWLHSSPMTLTYAFSTGNMIDYLDTNDIKTVFKRAFTRWAAVIPVSFSETESYKTADIRIGFYGGDHGDGEPFDGVLGVLGHAFSPENGRLHLDVAERWAVDFGSDKSKTAIDLESVATHEIGHVLGLAHSSVKESIMYPSLSPRSKKVDLRIDDVEGIQALYGSNPNFSFSSLLESEYLSNGAFGLESKLSTWFTCLAFLALVMSLFQ